MPPGRRVSAVVLSTDSSSCFFFRGGTRTNLRDLAHVSWVGSRTLRILRQSLPTAGRSRDKRARGFTVEQLSVLQEVGNIVFFTQQCQ